VPSRAIHGQSQKSVQNMNRRITRAKRNGSPPK
jgi:hypothetical protein